MCRGAPKHAPLILCHSLPCCHPLERRNFRQEPPAHIAMYCNAVLIGSLLNREKSSSRPTKYAFQNQGRAELDQV